MSHIKLITRVSSANAMVRAERRHRLLSEHPGTVSSSCDYSICRSTNKASKAVTMENINPNIVKLEYAVRGPLVIRATAIQKEIDSVSDGSSDFLIPYLHLLPF